MKDTAEGTLLWEPSGQTRTNANIARYMEWLEASRSLRFGDYGALWEWSAVDLEGFWSSVWEYYGVRASRPYERVLGRREMPGAEWFPGAELNFAEHVFRNATPDRLGEPAVMQRSETTMSLSVMTWRELRDRTAAFAAGLKSLGVGRGDRVAGYIPNIPEAIVAFLACASLGAVWSSCSPDFSSPGVVDRFAQIEPKVLIAVDGYRYGGKDYDKLAAIEMLQDRMPGLRSTVVLPYLREESDVGSLKGVVGWDTLLSAGDGAGLEFEQVPFDHPLWVLYSSGTTGLPKAIVQGHGGILMEHLKEIGLHMDVRPGDRFFWFTTTGWMMWNMVVGSLLFGATALLYDGSPGYPDLGALWGFAGKTRMTHFGASAGYITSCMKAGLEPARICDLPALRAVGSTGSPLPPDGFAWIYEHVGNDIWLFSVSGGTDLCTAFVGGCPLLPVRAGELQCRSLGASVQAFDPDGKPVVNEVGELVITEPMPSMPLYLWNDESGERYAESYFDMYPGVWRHGDWIKITPRGSAVIYGRSDSTINRGGVRMGTSEIYSAVESMPAVVDSLVLDIHRPESGASMLLFVVLNEGTELTGELRDKIKRRVQEYCSPRHVPDEILQIPEVPRTLNGKKLEVPIKRILTGTPPEEAVSKDSMINPRALEVFTRLAERLGRKSP